MSGPPVESPRSLRARTSAAILSGATELQRGDCHSFSGDSLAMCYDAHVWGCKHSSHTWHKCLQQCTLAGNQAPHSTRAASQRNGQGEHLALATHLLSMLHNSPSASVSTRHASMMDELREWQKGARMQPASRAVGWMGERAHLYPVGAVDDDELVAETREPSVSHPSTKSLTAFHTRNMNDPQKNALSLIL
jgi:hypothetical protein